MGTLFRQLFDQESSTYTYLLGDPDNHCAILIDPVLEQTERDLDLISELDLKLHYVLDTHAHVDHITGASRLRDLTGAKTAISQTSGVDDADIKLAEGDVIRAGRLFLSVMATPGHTEGCISYLGGDRIFTGDSLLVRSNGRTDFEGGSPSILFDSIQRLYGLAPHTAVYPGHDYMGRSVTTIGEERRFNSRITAGTTREEFIQTMENLQFVEAQNFHAALPAIMNGGKSHLGFYDR